MKKGDTVQASEKAYKVAEEIVKALAEKFNTLEYQQEGKWYAYTLGNVAYELSKTLGDWLNKGWVTAYYLHVWGFHEGKLKDIEGYVKTVKEMYEKAKKILTES
ncbi:hypothetical protein SJAV_27040 [Sulfurisphaera javensis]|uniref:PaREP1 family protein n=1 Tax=Sulfurisphaera javensis TaxID=2049879 RepID=A0AAT9GUZ5_9CREN